jgi:predicted metal-dependent peptidase
LSAEQIERYEKISKFQESLPLEKSAEWYFAALQNDADTKQAVQESTQGNGGELPIDADDHDAWDNLTDEEREMVKGKIKKVLEDAVKEADNGSKGWGSMSSSQRKVIRELVSNEIPWQAVLKKFCGFTRRANRASNHKRLNRKYPAIHPGIQRGYTSSIAVYIDQSGSVSDGNLEMLFAELRSLAKHTEFVCYHFDTEVDESSEATWRRGKTPVVNRTRCGGTDFSAPTRHANKNKHRFDGYLILTDGEAPDPGPTKLKRGWVIVPNRKLYFSASKRDFVINMKDKTQR